MSDLIRREDVLRLAESGKLLSGSYGERAKDIIKGIPSAEPTIDTIAERISDTTWYSIYNGKLVEGASGREEALYKAEDIFRILEEMGASDI